MAALCFHGRAPLCHFHPAGETSSSTSRDNGSGSGGSASNGNGVHMYGVAILAMQGDVRLEALTCQVGLRHAWGGGSHSYTSRRGSRGLPLCAKWGFEHRGICQQSLL